MRMRITAYRDDEMPNASVETVDAMDPAAVIRIARDKAARIVADHDRDLTELRERVADVEAQRAADQAVVDRFDTWLAAQELQR